MLVAGSGKQTLRNALQRLQTLSVTSEAALLGSSNPCLIARQQSSSATSGSESINVAAKVFYDSSIQLSRREQQVYLSANSRQRQLPSVAEHGYLYGFTEKELEGANELVKRALSTRTADASQGQRFRNQQLLQRLGNDARDSGNSAVQGEHFALSTVPLAQAPHACTDGAPTPLTLPPLCSRNVDRANPALGCPPVYQQAGHHCTTLPSDHDEPS